MSVTLNTPAQINMWVLLSRRHQIQLHLKGLTVKGLAACLKRELGDHGRMVKDYIVPVEFAISEAGGEIDYKLVNVHVMAKVGNGLFQDQGVFDSMESVEARPRLVDLYSKGRLEIVLTTASPRSATAELYAPA